MYISKNKSLKQLKKEGVDFEKEGVIICKEIQKMEDQEDVESFNAYMWEHHNDKLRFIVSTFHLKSTIEIANRYDNPTLGNDGFVFIEVNSVESIVVFYGQYLPDVENIPHIGNFIKERGFFIDGEPVMIGNSGTYAMPITSCSLDKENERVFSVSESGKCEYLQRIIGSRLEQIEEYLENDKDPDAQEAHKDEKEKLLSMESELENLGYSKEQ